MLIIGVILAAVPASGHVGGTVKHLWNKHIKPRVMNVAYTKEQADARFLQSVVYKDADKTTEPGGNHTLEVYCPSGTRAISGGSYHVNGFIAHLLYHGDRPLFPTSGLRGGPVGWADRVFNQGDSDVTWRVFVLCAS